jgi:hypothetical protein
MSAGMRILLAALLTTATLAAAVLPFMAQGAAGVASWLLLAVAAGIPFLLLQHINGTDRKYAPFLRERLRQ